LTGQAFSLIHVLAGSHQDSKGGRATKFVWTDQSWTGVPLKDLVLYELHVGTFSIGGTFDDAIPHLERLRSLGVNAIEIMPVATFDGRRNWGYDGVYIYAPHEVYGGPAGLQRLVDAAHSHGLAVILDVVYNHLGPGGEALRAFGPYFSTSHTTPWGPALNYDEAGSDAVREWAIQNACQWLADYHIDGLRLDATHTIYDASVEHILQELTRRVRRVRRTAILVAENSRTDIKLVEPRSKCGYGLDAMWTNDFHHALVGALTGDDSDRFRDFHGMESVAAALTTGVVLRGQYSTFRGRRQGPRGRLPQPARLVVFSQNHDQVGNRYQADRLPEATRRLAAFVALLAPFTPLLFMGEEYGETRPFWFFTDYSAPEIAQAAWKTRIRSMHPVPNVELPPDPQLETTFDQSKLERNAEDAELIDLYRRLLELRPTLPRLADSASWSETERWILIKRGAFELCYNFAAVSRCLPTAGGEIVLATGSGRHERGCIELGALSGAVVHLNH
jgi:maltooligosyltrehalose trehalohydrolase